MQIERDFAGRQILGARDEQQDSYAFSIVEGDENEARKILVLVADGMGGYAGGREASLTAVSGFVEAYFEVINPSPDSPAKKAPLDAGSQKADEESSQTLPSPAIPSALAPADLVALEEVSSSIPEQEPTVDKGSEVPVVPPHPQGGVQALKTALLAANHAVDTMIATAPDTLGEAGTTLVAAVIEHESIRWISVGDSPLLLWRNEKLRRLNADHSMRAVFAAKAAARHMLASDITTHPERNSLLSVLNGLEISKLDDPPDPVSLLPGDMILVASDGLLTLTAAEISGELKKLNKAPAIKVVRQLLERVEKKAHPKQDNTTIAVVRI